MTPPKAAQSLQQKASNAQTVLVEGGHQMMTEAPDAVLLALQEFLRA
jgi:pimeloyl-ACP methyl ester carboxylesterase